jgi:hypothetical protein
MKEGNRYFSPKRKSGGVGKLPILRGAHIEEESHTFNFPGLVS